MGRSEHTFGTNDTHCTPPEVFEPVLEALRVDRFGLDPFGNPFSDVPAENIIMLPEYKPRVLDAEGRFRQTCAWCDGDRDRNCVCPDIVWGNAYEFDWSGHGPVFCNGPTSNCAPWAEQGFGEEGGDENVSLWPARTAAKWFHKWVWPADALLFYEGRITFKGSTTQAPWHSLLSYVGPRGDLFAEGMKKYGHVVRNHRDWS